MTLALYLIVAGATLFVCHRWITPVSRGAVVVLLLLPFLFSGHALVRDRAYGGHDLIFLSQPFGDYAKEYGFEVGHNGLLVDQVLQMAPWQRQVRAAWSRGEWPLWNPAMNSGDILAAGMQPAPYHPLNLIALLLPVHAATAFDAAMIFFLAALFAYACARELGCSDGASLIAAAGYALSSGMAFFVGWPHGRSWSMLPLVLLAVHRLVRRRDRASCALLTIAFVLLIAFGHPETVLHIVAIGAVYGLYEVLPLRREALRPIALALVAGAIALCVMAISLLPFLDVLPESFEYHIRTVSAENPPATDWAQIRRIIRATFLPYSGGASWRTLTHEYEFGMARVGSVILALAAIAALRLWRVRTVRFFIVLAIVTLLAGWNLPPVSTALRALPLFDIALNARLAFAAAFSLSLLAAFAFDARAPLDRWIAVLVAVPLAVASALLWKWQLSLGVDQRLLIAGLAAEMIGIALLIFGLPRKSALAIVLIAIAAQRLVEDGNIYPAVPREQFYPTVPLVEAIPREPLYRVVGTGTMFVPNSASMYGLDDIRGYAAMTYTPYVHTMPLWCPDSKRLWHEVTDLSRPFLSFLGVRHALTPVTMEPPPGWEVLLDDRTSRLMVNTRALPRAFAPRRIRFMKDEEAAHNEMVNATDFADAAWLHADGPPDAFDNGRATLDVRRKGSRYQIDVDAASPTHVVITEVAWPGWRAYVDDREVAITRANRAFLSVEVPAGKHRVRLVYLPKAFVWGRAISLIAIVLCVGQTILSVRTKLR